jgi:hypothetical protein
VETGNLLLINMSVKGTIWNQKISNHGNDKSVDFDMDLVLRAQGVAATTIDPVTSG